jgi:hypothetical protein
MLWFLNCAQFFLYLYRVAIGLQTIQLLLFFCRWYPNYIIVLRCN